MFMLGWGSPFQVLDGLSLYYVSLVYNCMYAV